MQPSLNDKPTEPSGGGTPTGNEGSLRDRRSQVHPCELLSDHPTGGNRVQVYEEPEELGSSGLTGAGRALFMANGTLGEKDWKLSDLTGILKTAARLVTWDIGGFNNKDSTANMPDFDQRSFQRREGSFKR